MMQNDEMFTVIQSLYFLIVLSYENLYCVFPLPSPKRYLSEMFFSYFKTGFDVILFHIILRIK